MSGEWIKMRHDLHEDPAVIAIAAKLDIREAEVVGHLHWLWSWADKHSVDGNAVSVTAEWIDRKIGRPGFAAALVAARWLVIDDGTVTFPNFDRHNGETAKKRAVTNKRVSDHREVKRSSNAESNSGSVTPVTQGALLKALPEEEEEKKKDQEHARPKSRFEEFWLAYPCKKGKDKAEARWKAKGYDSIADRILADVAARQVGDRQWLDGFIPHGSTYVNGRGWEDAIEPPRNAARAAAKPAPGANDLDYLMAVAK